jgi:cell division protein FtsN
MKTKIILALAIAIFFGVSCKSKQKLVTIEGANKPAETAVSAVVVEETIANQEVTRNESFQFIDGDDALAKTYNVVVGSFKNKDNAVKLRASLREEGYNALIAINEQSMYRVIISSFNEYNQARLLISNIKNKFADAWVLIQKK